MPLRSASSMPSDYQPSPMSEPSTPLQKKRLTGAPNTTNVEIPKASKPDTVGERRSAVSHKLQQRAQKKAALILTPRAIERIRMLQENTKDPKLIRVGVKNKGCAGMSYHLEYVSPGQQGKFDECVLQDGVEVLIDSRALFSIIGSEMDWKEDKLSAKFVFSNPNIKDACGCGESFMI